MSIMHVTNIVEFATDHKEEFWFIKLKKGTPLALYCHGENYYGLGRVAGYCAQNEEVMFEFEQKGGHSREKYAKQGIDVKWTIEPQTDSNYGIHFTELKQALQYDEFKGTMADGRPLTTTTGGLGGNIIKIEKETGKEIVVKPKKFNNVDVVYSADDQIILPEGMTYKDAREWLTRKERESEKEVDIRYVIIGYPVDAALAFYKALQQTYGFTSMVPTPGFWGPTPPTMIGVEVSEDETVQIPWGSMQISGIDGRLETAIDFKDGQPSLMIIGSVKQKHKQKVDDLVKLAKYLLKHESIYKGRAIKVNFENYPPKDPRFDPLKAPKFMDLSRVNPDELVFSEKVKRQIEVTIWTPIQRTQLCRDHKIPIRRGALLAGQYGTGKTLAAQVTAKYAVENNWTYIYLENVEELPQAIHFAKMYAPSIVFAEDLNRIVQDDRDANMDKIFNTLDGVDTKHSEVMVIFTTNEIDRIQPGMMRPGRVDTIIEVTPPDALAVQKLVRLYGRGLVGDDLDLTLVGEKLDGQIPAIIREVVERSKLAAVSHLSMDEKLVVTAKDLEDAADGIMGHVNYIVGKKVRKVPDVEILGNVIGEHLKDGLTAALNEAGRPGKHVKNGSTEANAAS